MTGAEASGSAPSDSAISPNNPRIKRLARLIRDRRARRDENKLVVDGPRALRTFVAGGGTLEAVFTDRPDQPAVRESVGADISVFVVERSTLDRLSDAVGPQGILAIGDAVRRTIADIADRPRVVVLDGIQDPGNVGAIVRVAAAVGAAVVCSTGCADPTSPRAVRGSAGTVSAVDIVADIDLRTALDALSDAGHTIVGLTMDATATLGDIDQTSLVTIVLGGEGNGLSEAALDRLDTTVALPMNEPVESLNVAVSAGIVLYGLRPGST